MAVKQFSGEFGSVCGLGGGKVVRYMVCADPDLVVIGDANVDVVARISKYPSAGACAFGSEAGKFPGGSGVNVAVAAARMGLEVVLVTALGNDQHGDLVADLLRSEGVGTQFVKRVPKPTGSVFVAVDGSGKPTFFAMRVGCADWELTSADIHVEIIQRSRAVYVTGVVVSEAKVTKQSAQSASRAIVVAKAAGVPTFFDPNIRAEDWELPSEVLESLGDFADSVDFYLPNEAEYTMIGRKGLRPNGKATVVKAGERGCKVITCEGEVEIPAVPATSVDTTGAGDSFDAGFIVGVLETGNPVSAARVASAVAAITVSRVGTTSAFPTKNELSASWSQLIGGDTAEVHYP